MKNNCYRGICSGLSLFIAALLIFISTGTVFAQSKGEERPKDAKVVSEVEDGKGNIIRKIQYRKGTMLVTETIIMPKPLKVGSRRAINPDTLNRDSVVILVDKSHYSVMVFYRRKLIRNYKAVFGPTPDINKNMEGDRNTPEGWFTITRLNPNSKYNKFMCLSYPDASHWERFNSLKQRGVIPKSARIGGNVGIHGIWPGGDDMIEMGIGWTDGCIAICNKDMDDLYRIAGVGTRVFVRK